MATPQHTVRESIHTKLQETGEKDRYVRRAAFWPLVLAAARGAAGWERRREC